MFDLSGKVAVVTGGGRGIGRGVAEAMGQAGADVVVAGRTPETLRQTVAAVRAAGARAMDVPTDITRADDLAVLVARTLDEFGRVDCWVNNAGGAALEDSGLLLDVTERQWDAIVDVNLKWTFFAAQAAARAMTSGGSIVNISSRAGSQPNPQSGHYGAAKAGLDNLTATMAVEWGHLGIRVNAVAPGLVMTDPPPDSLDRPSRRRRQLEMTPLRRHGTPADIGAICVYLASDEAGWLTGEVIQMTGGSRLSAGYLNFFHHLNDRLGRDARD